MNKIDLKLGGLTCANCAGLIDEKVKRLDEVNESNLNFISSKLTFKIKEEYDIQESLNKVVKIVDDTEPGLVIELLNSSDLNLKIRNRNQKNELSNLSTGKEDCHENKNNSDFEVSDKKILMSAVFLYVLLFLAKKGGLSETIFNIGMIVTYLIAGREVLISAFKNLFNGKVMDENFLMTIATLGAIAIGEYPEAVGVMIFYGIGELLEDKAVDKSRKNISSLMDIKAKFANVLIGDKIVQKNPEDVEVGQEIVVKPGEKVALDSTIIKGSSSFDNSAITGESKLVKLGEGDSVLAGTINKDSLVHMKVDKIFSDSTVARILDMVENASVKKAKKENFISIFARYYTPIVVVLAILIVILPTFILGQDFTKWLYRGLIFLVVSCPCALVLSIPLSYFSGIGLLSKNGVLVKGSNYIDVLRSLKTIVFDKTGTLTEGIFKVRDIKLAKGVDEYQLLKYAYIAEMNSTHPIAKSVIAYVKAINKDDFNINLLESYEEIPAMGIIAKYDGHEILAGNSRLMEKYDINYEKIKSNSSKVYLACDNYYMGCIEIYDDLKIGTESAINSLRKRGVEEFIILTGDSKENARALAEELSIDKVYAQLLPDQKVEKVEEIMSKRVEKERGLAFVGDGINDAPVIARADLGISMGQIGSDAAIEASDIVLMKDDLNTLARAIDISKYTNKIVIQNIVMAIGIKVLIMILSMFGLANMWMAIFADVGVALLAVLNSLRIFRFK